VALLSRTAQLEVDRAKDGVEDLQERIDSLQGFANGFALWVLDLKRFSQQIFDTEHRLTTLIEKHFDAGTPEAQELIARTRIGDLPSPATEDELHRKFERNVARAQDALQDVIKILEEKISTLRAGDNPAPKTFAQAMGDQQPSSKKERLLILKPTLWGMGIDLRELWRRIRGS
jgi:hypothetical protein